MRAGTMSDVKGFCGCITVCSDVIHALIEFTICGKRISGTDFSVIGCIAASRFHIDIWSQLHFIHVKTINFAIEKGVDNFNRFIRQQALNFR